MRLYKNLRPHVKLGNSKGINRKSAKLNNLKIKHNNLVRDLSKCNKSIKKLENLVLNYKIVEKASSMTVTEKRKYLKK